MLSIDNYVSSWSGSNNNYGIGLYQKGEELIQPVLDKISKIIERADSF